LICKVSSNILSITNFLANWRLISFRENYREKFVLFLWIFFQFCRMYLFIFKISIYLYIYIFSIYFILIFIINFQIKKLLNSIWNYLKNMTFNFNKIYFTRNFAFSIVYNSEMINLSTFSLKKNCLPKLAGDFFVKRTLNGHLNNFWNTLYIYIYYLINFLNITKYYEHARKRLLSYYRLCNINQSLMIPRSRDTHARGKKGASLSDRVIIPPIRSY